MNTMLSIEEEWQRRVAIELRAWFPGVPKIRRLVDHGRPKRLALVLARRVVLVATSRGYATWLTHTVLGASITVFV
jgi:hypothetical protein